MKERTYLLETEFRKYTDREINDFLLEEIINSNFDTWQFMVLEPDKPIQGSVFMQVGAPATPKDSPFFLEISFGSKLYLLETKDKNVVLQHLNDYWKEQIVPDISLWEDISDSISG